MQKRDLGKSGGSSGKSLCPPPKRGRLFGSSSANSAAAVAAENAISPSALLGLSLLVHNSFVDQNNKRRVLALQSGLKSEVTWALNTLTLLSIKEKEDI